MESSIDIRVQNSGAVLQSLAAQLESLAPEVRKAATYVVENPNDVGVSSIRELAEAADVKPNTFVRMARAIGFEGYEDFRHPFREEIRNRGEGFQDRARWLQSLKKDSKLDGLYAEMAAGSISNVEQTFANTSRDQIEAAALAVMQARRTYVLGFGIAHALARNFAYIADMAIDNVVAIPRDGSLAIDDLARADEQDVLLAMTFKPFRSEVIDAVATAKDQGTKIIGISDSPVCPIVTQADHPFVVPTDSAQFFTSTVPVAALLETLMSFVIAESDQSVIDNIESFHQRRHDLGIYWARD